MLSTTALVGFGSMRDQIIKILKSQINTAQIADDIAPHVINAEIVADLILAISPSGTGAADHRQLNDLIKTAEAFRAAMVSSNVVGRYHKELRALESALDPLNYRSEARAAEPGARGAAAACSAVSKILCGEASCTDAGNWRCPQNVETADEMIVEIVDAVFALATPTVRGALAALQKAIDGVFSKRGLWIDWRLRDQVANAILSLPVQPGAGERDG